MKQILFFNDSLAMGGTEKLLVGLLTALVKKECEITLLLPEPSDKDVLLESLPSAVAVKYLYGKDDSYLKKKLGQLLMVFCPRIFARWKGVSASDYDLVVCFKDTFYACLFSVMEVRKILWIHNILYHHQYEIRSLKERLAVWLNKKQIKQVQKSYNKFDQVICVSDSAKKAYLDVLHGGVNVKQDIRVIYNAIDLSFVQEKAKEPIAALPQGQVNFVLLTRTSAEKRVDRLFHAASRLKNEGFPFHVYVLGEGVDSEPMKKEVEKLALGEVVTLMGVVKNPYPYILQANWLLCVSERESFSLTLLEAMALKTPVITTNCGGPSDIVDGGKYGILVENSTDGVYKGMKAVITDHTLSVQYSKHLDEAVSRFSYEGWLTRIYSLFEV